MEHQSKIYIAGHLGMVGSAIHRNLLSKGYTNFIFRTLEDLDLTRQADVEDFFEAEKPDYVFVAAAKVGGIVANNTYRAQFIYENLMIQNNIIHAAYLNKVKKLLFLGSSCIYPKNALQPLKEEYLLTGLLEETNEPYAIAKIAGIKMCENYYRQYGCDFISVMPTNLYGPNDNYDLEKSHVLPALIRKMHLGKCLEQGDWDAIRTDLNKRSIEGTTGHATQEEILNKLDKYGIRHTVNQSQSPSVNPSQSLPVNPTPSLPVSPSQSHSVSPSQSPTVNQSPSLPVPQSPTFPVQVEIWGTGQVFREFLYVDDMADACVHIMQNVSSEKLYKEMKQTHINIGTGVDLTIHELAETVKQVVDFGGILHWDTTKPDGTLKKQLDVNLLHNLNWKHKISLDKGIKDVYEKYCN